MMASTSGVSKCPMCSEEITDKALHFRKCKAMELTSSSTDTETKQEDDHPLSSETAKVKFSWTSSSGFSYSTITLLSGFQQSIELYLDRPTSKSRYISDTVEVPVGEFDGQLVIGSSYCYPVKKFLIEQDGEVIPLELDLSKLEHDHDHDHDDDTHNGKYSDYVTAYTTSPGGEPDVHYNPAYDTRHDSVYTSAYGYDDSVGGGRGTERTSARLLMVFTPTSGTDADAMYSPVDIVYAKKNRQEQPQLTGYSHNDAETSPTDPLGETFSQQLSEEGFTPATVKSKKSASTTKATTTTTKSNRHASSDPSTRTTSTVSSRPAKSPTVTRPPPPPPTSPPPYPRNSSTHTTAERVTTEDTQQSPPDKRGREGRFAVSNIQSSSNQVGREEYARVCEERNSLKRDHERVKAQLEGQIRRLQKKLNQFEGGGGEQAELCNESDDRVAELEMIMTELREELDDAQQQMEAKERELAESHDRATALEDQLQEYAGTVQEQNRLIHNYTHHGGGMDRQYAKLKELNIYTTEFIKKQQIEFQEKIQDLEKKIKGMKIMEFEEENHILRESCEKMTRDIKDYRNQTKHLLKDIEGKRKEMLALREELQHGGRRNPSEMEALEIETLRQKCDGWRESAERSSEEVEVLRIQVQQLEQERDSLNQELQGLAEKLQSALSDKETGQSKTSSLQKQMKELQDTRVSLELKLGKLRSEKTELAERNAHLVEVCDPDNISKVKQELEQVLEEKEILEAELKSTQDNLALHQERNLELQEQLEKTSDPQKLAQIQQRMQRYKQERETAKRELETVREEMEIKHREDVENLERMIDELKRKKRKYREHCKAYEQLNGELQLQIKEKDDLIAFLQNVHDYGHQEEKEEEEEEEEEDGEGVVNSEEEMGVSHTDSSYSFSSRSEQVTGSHHQATSSTHSVPVILKSQRKTMSGVITTATPKVDSTHRGSYTSLVEQPPRRSSRGSGSHTSNPNNPSLNLDERLIVVQVHTKRGLRETYVQKMDQDTLAEDIKVIVKRKGGVYEEGMVRYFGYPNLAKCELVIGIELAMQRKDSQGSSNDGVYRDGQRYFKCARGHGLFTTLTNLYIEIIVT